MSKPFEFVECGGRLIRLNGLVEVVAPIPFALGSLQYDDGSRIEIGERTYGHLMAAFSTHPDVSIHRVARPAKPDDES